jgi:hypothetical protein
MSARRRQADAARAAGAMNGRTWLRSFLDAAASAPAPLLRAIASARRDELPALAAAIELVPSAEVRVVAYTALARRSRERRDEYVTRAAEASEHLADPYARARVLTALADALPEDALRRALARLADTDPSVRQRLRAIDERLRPRPPITDPVPAVLPEPTPPARFDLDALAARLEAAHRRADKRPASGMPRIRPLGPPRGRGRTIRLAEIAEAVRLEPHSLRFVEQAAAAASGATEPVTGWPAGLAEEAAEAYEAGAAFEAGAAYDAGAAFEAAVGSPLAEMARPERVVSTGFADASGAPVRPAVRPGERHYYFIEVGARVEGAIDASHALPADLPPASLIDVVMTTSDDGLVIEGPRTGQFRIEASGAVTVSRRAATVEAEEELLARRMFFAFRAPAAPAAPAGPGGACSLRCSFYCRGLLLQSRHIRVPVGSGKRPSVHADYVRSRTLSPGYLARLEPPRLSVLLNRNGDGSHSFRFYGDGGRFERSSTFGELELRDHIARARKGYRQAAWGTEDEWTTSDAYRFRTPRTLDALGPDLADLARRGRVLWDAIVDKLAGGADAADELRELMRPSGHVQFALKEAANAVLPIALLYDHALDVTRPAERFTICSAFVQGLGGDLPAADCFNGECPNRDRDDIVCPGGFWGYRHAIGLPVSLGADQSSPPEPPAFITSGDASFTIGVSTDPLMAGRVTHLSNLQLQTDAPQTVAELRDAVLEAMRSGAAPIVYFYCHGGLSDLFGPFIEIGPRDAPPIARATLRDVRWRDLRPLVFINGCHTTGVSPEEALELVSAFVATSGAAGVIGTEITVFESLAAAFAEAFFVEFVTNGRQAGEALRRARLRLLKDALNPLGLVYIPFVDSGLWLREPPTG